MSYTWKITYLENYRHIAMTSSLVGQPISQPSQEQRFILRGLTWQKFKALQTDLEAIPGVKLSYFHGTLELMTVSPEHEDLKSLIGTLVELYLIETGMRYYRRGGPALKQEPDVELLPDDSFNLGSKKAVPDIAIEVIITSGSVDKLAGYKTLNVPEVWFLKNGRLTLYHLHGDTYDEISSSELLPELDLSLLVRCMNMSDEYDAVTAFRQAM
jgi:Uma2 family endonuclease